MVLYVRVFIIVSYYILTSFEAMRVQFQLSRENYGRDRSLEQPKTEMDKQPHPHKIEIHSFNKRKHISVKIWLTKLHPVSWVSENLYELLFR